jgi:hypothetical protein
MLVIAIIPFYTFLVTKLNSSAQQRRKTNKLICSPAMHDLCISRADDGGTYRSFVKAALTMRMESRVLSYSPSQRRVVLGIPLVLVLLTVGLSFHPRVGSRLDVCFIQREFEKPGPTRIPIGDSALHNFSVLAVWASVLVLLLLPADRYYAVFQLTYAALWFHSTYILLAALKAPLEDYACAGRHSLYPNGISGHYCYFVFVAMTVPFLWNARLRSNPQASSRLMVPAVACLLCFVIGATATLHRTIMHGYHSPRQIMLGIALGMSSHGVLERVFLGLPRQRNSIPLLLAFLCAIAVSSYALYELVWPKLTAGHALTTSHFVFHLSLWLVLIASAMKWQDELTGIEDQSEKFEPAAQ